MKAFLYAYDKVNLGDDLFIEMLVNRYPKVQFYMWSTPENRRVFSDLKNLHIWDPEGWFPRFLRKLRPSLGARWTAFPKDRCDCCIYIGGSIFQEYDTWPHIVNWWQYHSRHYPFYVLGANFGPWHTPEYQQGMAEAFRNLKDLCFRDQYSHNLFPDCSRVAPDILFAQEFPNVKSKKQVFISAIDCQNGPNGLHSAAAHYEHCLAEMAMDYVSHGYEVIFASFCKAEGDEDTCLRLQNALKDRGAESRTLFYTGSNREEMLREIAASAFVVGTRFHACVLGLAAGKPVLPILYSDKTKNMLKDIGFSGPSMDLREEFGPVLFEQLDQTLMLDISSHAQRAGKHYEKLDKLYGK